MPAWIPLRRLIADADVLVIALSALPAELLDHAPRLIGIVRRAWAST